ncbi:MAG: hypothetical protein KDD33_00705 [Bdellovibrionales bacterium]|nr:hypothetical protein [Bdellovibrionales bacterium]
MSLSKDLVFLDCERKMPLMKLPIRSVCVQLEGAKIFFSPGSTLKKKTLQNLSAVSDIVASNLFHCAGIEQTHNLFPEAKIWGPQGVNKTYPEIPWKGFFTQTPWPYEEDLTHIPVLGMPMVRESVFCHKKSRTLLVTDLCFNMQESKGVGTWIILNLFGTYRRFAISKLFAGAIKDKEAFKKSMDLILQLDFDNLVMSHGLSIEGRAKDRLVEALKERGLNPD